MEPICRFCLEPKEANNVLISPCKCAGSVQYVHIQCIKKWRRMTENSDFIMMCQICLTKYNMPLKYPLEDIPNIHFDIAWYFLSRPYIFAIISHYVLMVIIGLMSETEINMKPHGYIIPYVSISRIVNIQFIGISTAVFTLYLSYFMHHIKRVKNMNLYAKFLIQHRIRHVFPRFYLMSLLASYYMIGVCVVPSALIFVLLLPKYMEVHKEILHKINSEAEVE
jgi:hypothetical protein